MKKELEQKSKIRIEVVIAALTLGLGVLAYVRPPDPARPVSFDFLSRTFSVPLWVAASSIIGVVSLTMAGTRWLLTRSSGRRAEPPGSPSQFDAVEGEPSQAEQSREINARATISLPKGFRFGQLSDLAPKSTGTATPTPSLGPLAAFTGDWAGNGFNTIFRPDSTVTRTPLPNPVPSPPPRDNILELNLTSESLSFSPSLGSVPNRATATQEDIFLNGVPYLQTVDDITVHGESVGIHVEPGMWIHVPATRVPPLGGSVTRMACIPHGTTIEAQGTFLSFAGPPMIAPVDITPFVTGSNPPNNIRFASQIASNPNTPRIPQDLGSFITRGTITQAMLDDPNSLLRSHISQQNITGTTTIIISTGPPPPPQLLPFGGGVNNIAFLLGRAAATAPNAQALQMFAIFWIETVEEVIEVPPFKVGGSPFAIKAKQSIPGQRVATFSVTPPFDLDRPRKITVEFLQIQYTQTVLLNFAGLTWPHVSVNTLVPADEIIVPHSAWSH
jgi:hypothetical protein